MRAARSFIALSVAALASLAGCGGEARDATSKELSALTAEISKLRAEQAAMTERLDALERGKAKAPDSAAPAAPAMSATAMAPPLDSDRPALDVVRLGPQDDVEGDGDIDAAGPRTVLRSGSNGIVVEEKDTPSGAARTVQTDAAGAKKQAPAAKKTDKVDRKKTASLPAP